MNVQHWPWSPAEDEKLKAILSAGEGVDAAARLLTRTHKAVRARAAKLRVSAKKAVQPKATSLAIVSMSIVEIAIWALVGLAVLAVVAIIWRGEDLPKVER